MNGVLLVLTTVGCRSSFWWQQVRGMRRYAAARGWRVDYADSDGEVDAVRAIVKKKRPVGIVSMLHARMPARAFCGVPHVFFDIPASFVPDGELSVRHDDAQTARLAARELFSLPCRDFAFAGYYRYPYTEIPDWSAAREAFFAREVARRGGRLAPAFHPPLVDSAAEQDCAMRSWLAVLPRPCGVFAANDSVASAVRRLARRLKLNIPGDLAVVGVDDVRMFCLRSHPTVTSVRPDWEGGGYAAAEFVGALVDGKKIARGGRTFGPLGVIRRESTARGSCRLSPRVAAAVSLIRARACSGLRAADVVAAMRCSRRYADKTFRDVTGSSIQEEIRRVRFETAKVLLANSREKLFEIAEKCGCKSLSTFCREFKRVTGMTAESWRRRRR